MLRAAPFALLVSILTVAVQAQRSKATLDGHAGGVRGPFVGQRSLSNAFFPQHGVFPSRFNRHPHGILFPYFLPDYDPFWYEQSDAEATVEPAPPVVIERGDDAQSRMRQKPVPKSQIIEIPGVANSRAAEALPPTIFILSDGERVETQQYLLTASYLSVNVSRHQRTIPLQKLNIDATITANHERGIDLCIPADRNEISLRF